MLKVLNRSIDANRVYISSSKGKTPLNFSIGKFIFNDKPLKTATMLFASVEAVVPRYFSLSLQKSCLTASSVVKIYITLEAVQKITSIRSH